MKGSDMNKTYGALLGLLLTACGSSGVLNMNLMGQPIPKDQARLMITRSNDLLYLAAGANVRINGHLEGALARGGTLIQDVPAGRTMLSVNATMDPGNYTINFEAKAGETYAMEVSPRSEGFAGSATWGILGDAIHANLKDNTGYFKVVLKDIK